MNTESVNLIQELVRQHPGEWLAIQVSREREGQPEAGELVYHSPDKDEVWRKTAKRPRLFILYAGPPLKEGYAAAF